MATLKRNVFDPMIDWSEFMQPLFPMRSDVNGEEVLALDISETQDHDIVVKASVPGFRKEEIDVSIDGDILSIRAFHTEKKEEKKDNWIRRERKVGTLSRRVQLHHSVDESKVSAKLEDGVLVLTLPHAKGVPGKKIEIR